MAGSLVVATAKARLTAFFVGDISDPLNAENGLPPNHSKALDIRAFRTQGEARFKARAPSAT
jgi:hypothetical protein